MPATAESMGMGAGASMSSDKMDLGATVKVFGLLAMGLTLILMGLGFLPTPYSAGFAAPTFRVFLGTAGTFGGLALAIVGLLALYRGHQFWGTAFLSYGAFFIVWVSTVPTNFGGPTAPATAIDYGLAGFSFIFVLLTLTFLINSMKHGWMTFFLFLFLFISMILWLVEYWMAGAGSSISTGQQWATGGLTILTGLIGWYAGTAALTNGTYGKKLLPG